MKPIYFALILLLMICPIANLFAQAPNAIPYQAVARNATGNLIPNQLISLHFSLHDSSANGTIVYRETQSITTNALGLFNVNIGQGIPMVGNFSTINWKNNSKFLRVELDANGGTNYTNMGTTQMLSVPYALYAEKTGTIPPGNNIGDVQYWNGSSWVMIPIGLPGQVLQVSQNNIPKWSGVSFPTITLNPVVYSSTYDNVYIVGSVTAFGSNASGDSTTLKSRGICWDTLPNPTILNTKSYYNDQYTQIATVLTNLLANKTYYVRGYATNNAGVGYSNQTIFTTLASVPPTLTTTSATNITGGTLTAGGNITDLGPSIVTARGLCWSTNPNPTIADSITETLSAVGLPLGNFSNGVKHLSRNTTYYLRAYATNEAGTGYGNQITITTTSAYTIGGYYLGGIISYILQSSDPGFSSTTTHGIIAAPSDLSGTWNNNVITASPLTPNTAIGTGNANTTVIVNAIGGGTYAAKLCYDLVLNGYSNWYLPSLNELGTLYTNRTIIGGFLGTSYWSSNDNPADVTQAYYNYFNTGVIYLGNKNTIKSVRPIKSF